MKTLGKNLGGKSFVSHAKNHGALVITTLGRERFIKLR